MPTYEYQCTKCKKKFEKLQRITQPPLRKCIYCGARPERLIGAGVGLIFKGTGFYATDYKKKPSEKKSEDKKEPTPKPSSDKKKE